METQHIQTKDTCSVCLDEIHNILDKRYFTCGHFICKSCYTDFRMYQLNTVKKDVFCPECRNIEERYVSQRRPRLIFMGNIVAVEETPISFSNDIESPLTDSPITNVRMSHESCVASFYLLMIVLLMLVISIIVWYILQCSNCLCDKMVC